MQVIGNASDQNVLNTRRGGAPQHSVTSLAKSLLGGKKQARAGPSLTHRVQTEMVSDPSQSNQPPSLFSGIPFDSKAPPLHDINKWKGHF